MTEEEKLAVIEDIIAKKRNFWALNSLAYMDYDDVAQLIRIHFQEKINQWTPDKGSFEAWAATVAKNRIKNLIRDNYGKVAPPCNRCPFNNGGDFCAATKSGIKDSSCKEYKKWFCGKRAAYELKLSAPLEDYDGAQRHQDFDVEKTAIKFHEKMKACLSPKMYSAYLLLYVENLTDEEIVKKLGFKKTKEEGRIPGYRQLTNIKNKLIELGKDIVKEIELEL